MVVQAHNPVAGAQHNMQVVRDQQDAAAARIPRLRDTLRFCEGASPRTMERYTRNESGAIYGFALTPAQVRLCSLIRRGLANKEIARLEHLSTETVRTHRRNIRRKLGLINKKVNLSTYLATTFNDSH